MGEKACRCETAEGDDFSILTWGWWPNNVVDGGLLVGVARAGLVFARDGGLVL